MSEYPVVLDIVIQAPTYIFSILFFILMPLTVIEKTSFIKALKRTLELSKGNYFAILGLFLLNFVVAAIFGAVIWACFSFFAEFPDLFDMLLGSPDVFVQTFVLFVQWGLMLVFTVALWTAAYARLLAMQETDLTQD
ncbi:glycerophosphoryl diester phosphodiesterase membrane domain-containing protein [Kiloniella majae]|uniref:glycerophosphoryl diester phosphodiesterase membrane domain-containing protein n=1 Tax=Kiloniella majae TaxID=1938558 RepID=UPI000F798B22|nr:glycerophosphoryl diester phosphodiesterase membrane domain-containing protein [Kiloniella majae]